MATVVTPSTTTRGPSVVQDAADQLDALDIKIRRSKHQKQQKQAELQEVRDVFYHAESLEEREQKEKDKAALESAGSSITNSTDSSTTTSTTTDTTKQTEASLVSALEPQANGATATTATTRPRYVAAKDFELLKVIGMGAFGKVLQVRNKKSKNILAMKVISKRLLRRKAGYIENVQAERNILTKVRHPFVVTMHCSFQSREKLFIIMDFLAGGELFLRLGREGIFLEKTAAFYLAEIILALDHLHHHGVLHRDLKPENILLGSDGHVCVTDFGLAKDFSGEGGFQNESDETRALTVCGTMEYMAPEMVARKGYGRAADYWSLGCIAFEMLTGQPPFRSKNGAKDLFSKIMSERVKMPDGSTPAACKLLKGLLNRNVQVRLGAARSTMFEVGGVAGLKKADFFKTIDWDKMESKTIEPPDLLPVDHDEDLRHFHDEFTAMPLPRSVVEMSQESFNARRVESEAFRGFSFIQDDFCLPDRHGVEEQSYWDAVDEDGESVSDCASSKHDGDDPPVIEETVAQRKKRPPRKRKPQKPAGQAVSTETTPAPSTDTTPAPSAACSPAASENGDVVVPVKAAEVVRVVAAEPPPPAQVVPSVSSPPPVPVRKVVQESWQSVNVSPKKASNRSVAKAPVSQLQARPSPQIQNKGKVDSSLPQNQWSTAPPAGRRNNNNAPSALTATSSSWRPGAPPPQHPISHSTPPPGSHLPAPPPSTDWRQHTLSPRTPDSVGRGIRQPPAVETAAASWPSLGPDPPLSSNPKTPAVSIQRTATKTTTVTAGAWGTRAKR